MLSNKHIHLKSNTNKNKFKEIALNDLKNMKLKSNLINSNKNDNKQINISLDNNENRTQKKIKPLLISEKNIKFKSQTKRIINKNNTNNKQIRLNLSANKRKINDNFKKNNINNVSTIDKSNEKKQNLNQKNNEIKNREKNGSKIKKFIYNKKTQNIKENYKKKNNIGDNVFKIGLNISSINNKKSNENKKENSIKVDKKSLIKNKLKYGKSIDKQKTLNIIVQKRLFSKKESKKDKNLKSSFKINQNKKKNNINHHNKISSLIPSKTIDNASETDSDSVNKNKYKKNKKNMNFAINKKEKTKTLNKKEGIKIVEFKNNKHLLRRSIDNPSERNKIEHYMNKILLKNNGGNSLFLKNYELGSLLEKEINMIINKQIIKKDIKICSCTKAGLSCAGIVKSNQDSFFIQENFMSNLDYFFIGVCDGHGQDGQIISNIVANKLPNYITSLSNEEIISNFKKINSEIYCDSGINSTMSGTTVVSLIITPEKLISINLGDSRLSLFKYDNKNKKYFFKNLSREHKPFELDESERILSQGGRLQKCYDEKTNKYYGPQRVWLKNEDLPGLAMTRSLGDKIAHNIGVIDEPEIKKYFFDENEKFIIIASDGLWEFINGEQCINIVKNFYEEKKDVKGAALELTKEAFNKWKRKEIVVDDITVIVIFFY